MAMHFRRAEPLVPWSHSHNSSTPSSSLISAQITTSRSWNRVSRSDDEDDESAFARHEMGDETLDRPRLSRHPYSAKLAYERLSKRCEAVIDEFNTLLSHNRFNLDLPYVGRRGELPDRLAFLMFRGLPPCIEVRFCYGLRVGSPTRDRYRHPQDEEQEEEPHATPLTPERNEYQEEEEDDDDDNPTVDTTSSPSRLPQLNPDTDLYFLAYPTDGSLFSLFASVQSRIPRRYRPPVPASFIRPCCIEFWLNLNKWNAFVDRKWGLIRNRNEEFEEEEREEEEGEREETESTLFDSVEDDDEDDPEEEEEEEEEDVLEEVLELFGRSTEFNFGRLPHTSPYEGTHIDYWSVRRTVWEKENEENLLTTSANLSPDLSKIILNLEREEEEEENEKEKDIDEDLASSLSVMSVMNPYSISFLVGMPSTALDYDETHPIFRVHFRPFELNSIWKTIVAKRFGIVDSSYEREQDEAVLRGLKLLVQCNTMNLIGFRSEERDNEDVESNPSLTESSLSSTSNTLSSNRRLNVGRAKTIRYDESPDPANHATIELSLTRSSMNLKSLLQEREEGLLRLFNKTTINILTKKSNDALFCAKQLREVGLRPALFGLISNLSNDDISNSDEVLKGGDSLEEVLFRRTDYLLPTIDSETGSRIQDVPYVGALYTSPVHVFRESYQQNYVVSSDGRFDVATVMASSDLPSRGQGGEDGEEEGMCSVECESILRSKLCCMFNVAKLYGHDSIIISCGDFISFFGLFRGFDGISGRDLGLIFRNILLQFNRFFARIVFAFGFGDKFDVSEEEKSFRKEFIRIIENSSSFGSASASFRPSPFFGSIIESGESSRMCPRGGLCPLIQPEGEREGEDNHTDLFVHPPPCPLGPLCSISETFHRRFFCHAISVLDDMELAPVVEDVAEPMAVRRVHGGERRRRRKRNRNRNDDNDEEEDDRPQRRVCRRGNCCRKYRDPIHVANFSHPTLLPLCPKAEMCSLYLRRVSSHSKSFAHVCRYGPVCPERHVGGLCEGNVHIMIPKCRLGSDCVDLSSSHRESRAHVGWPNRLVPCNAGEGCRYYQLWRQGRSQDRGTTRHLMMHSHQPHEVESSTLVGDPDDDTESIRLFIGAFDRWLGGLKTPQVVPAVPRRPLTNLHVFPLIDLPKGFVCEIGVARFSARQEKSTEQFRVTYPKDGNFTRLFRKASTELHVSVFECQVHIVSVVGRTEGSSTAFVLLEETEKFPIQEMRREDYGVEVCILTSSEALDRMREIEAREESELMAAAALKDEENLDGAASHMDDPGRCSLWNRCSRFDDERHRNELLHPFKAFCPRFRHCTEYLRNPTGQHARLSSHLCPYGALCENIDSQECLHHVHEVKMICPTNEACEDMDPSHREAYLHHGAPYVLMHCAFGESCSLYSRWISHGSHDLEALAHVKEFRHDMEGSSDAVVVDELDNKMATSVLSQLESPSDDDDEEVGEDELGGALTGYSRVGRKVHIVPSPPRTRTRNRTRTRPRQQEEEPVAVEEVEEGGALGRRVSNLEDKVEGIATQMSALSNNVAQILDLLKSSRM